MRLRAVERRPVEQVHTFRRSRLTEPYPNGESWQQATVRGERFLSDLPLRWEESRVLVLGHVATYWGLECALNGADLRALVQADFE
jgi:2,3-bisphosphoglycerate-dependent phosphoglycerate mutase